MNYFIWFKYIEHGLVFQPFVLLMSIQTIPKLEYFIVHSKEFRFFLQKDFAMATLARIDMRGITTIAEPRL